MEALKTVGLAVLAAVVYGVAHDQVTARVCVEYFTVGHPPVIASTDPTLLGLAWGVLASWWVGLPMGLALAAAARLGRRPKRSARSLVKPVGLLLGLMAAFALAAGVAGGLLAGSGTVVLGGALRDRLPPAKWGAFQACAFAHQASYSVAFAAGGMVIAWVWVSRKRLRA